MIVNDSEPVLNQRGAVGVIGMVDPKIQTEVFAARHKTLAVSYYAADAAAGTRYNQSDILAGQL